MASPKSLSETPNWIQLANDPVWVANTGIYLLVYVPSTEPYRTTGSRMVKIHERMKSPRTCGVIALLQMKNATWTILSFHRWLYFFARLLSGVEFFAHIEFDKRNRSIEHQINQFASESGGAREWTAEILKCLYAAVIDCLIAKWVTLVAPWSHLEFLAQRQIPNAERCTRSRSI